VEEQVYTLRLVSKENHELAQLRSTQLEQLKRIVEDIKDTRQQLKNIGLPLTIIPHDKAHVSLLSSYGDEEISLKGIVNLLVLLLLCYHVRMIAQSLIENDFILADVVRCSPT
jgi:hypothetical protein